jgi:type II secretory pathway component PulF
MNNASQPATTVGPRIVAAIAALGVHFFTLILAMVVLCSVVPKYVEFFEQRDGILPLLTQQVIDLSSFAVSYWYLIVFLGMVIDTAIVALLSFVSKRKWLLSIYSHLWLLAVIFFLFWISLVLGAPIQSIRSMR